MVLLSDGDDTSSAMAYRDALEYARRSGVTIYTIGLNVGKLQTGVRGKLTELARETGGRTFFISQASELTLVYKEIEEELGRVKLRFGDGLLLPAGSVLELAGNDGNLNPSEGTIEFAGQRLSQAAHVGAPPVTDEVTLASGEPILASSAAIRISQARANS